MSYSTTTFFSYPLKFVLDGAWQVVAGEESKELEAQTQREMRVIEDIYPHPSSIPPKYNSCPSFL